MYAVRTLVVTKLMKRVKMTNTPPAEPPLDTYDERMEAYAELLLISNMRLYDVMLNVFSELAGNDEAQALRAKHMDNQFYYPPVVVPDDAD